MEGNLHDKIMQLCIEQLRTANTKEGLYKARYVKSDPKDEKSYKIDKRKIGGHIRALLKRDTYKNPSDIFRRLLISGQNRNMMPKVINFMGREAEFRKILCGEGSQEFDYKKVINKNPHILLNEFKKNFNIKKSKKDDDISENTNEKKVDRSLWAQYAKFIVDAALLMEKVFEEYEEANDVAEYFRKRLEELAEGEDKYKCQKYLAEEITGMGFALACDFLKEIGGDMAKPDTHIMDYLEKYHSGKLDKKEGNLKDYEENKNIKKREVAAVEVMNDLAGNSGNAGHDVYALDKLIWLCCSGNYYEKKSEEGRVFDGIIVEPKSLKDLFLENVK